MFHSVALTARNIAVLLLMSATLWVALFASAQAEVIRSFDSDILINDDGSFLVTETIVYDFGQEFRHGIFRKVKDVHPQKSTAWYKTRYIELTLVSVTRDGLSEPYTTEPYNGLSLKVGDANKQITGPHIYQIVYAVKGGLAEYPETVELYWNVTGDDWPTTIEAASAKVSVAAGVQLLSDQYCYAGPQGSSERCDSIEPKNTAVLFSEKNIFPGYNLTIAQSLELAVAPPILEKTNHAWLGLIGFFAWFTFLCLWIYRWRVAFRPSRTIIPQYEPLPDFKPMFTGVLFDNRLDARDITAAIVYSAQQGFISIRQTTHKVGWLFGVTDYEVTLLRPLDQIETKFQRQVLTLIFNPITGVGVTKKISDIKSDQSQLRKNMATIQALRKSVVAELVKQGLLEQVIGRAARVFLATALIITSPHFLSLSPFGTIFNICIWITAMVLLVASFERRTEKGYEAFNYLKGFKDYLSVTEKGRYMFHNAPALSPKQFMEYLPYAIAFGVEKEWSHVFKDIQIEQPNWYNSASGSGFNAVALTNSIGAFSTALAKSSGASSSSGGGHSGGGGGGGGGGSW
ncbi:DUF2207 domain-containing protein [Candidatus Kaiserbacteria bacterium]|nr:DUF2207 domain-containing protein [Candidatus Kaiserbacteria bacterium]NCT01663.1 DUF2207 domain-containing protein [Candidatus Parcubacteria bacterium]